MDAEGLRGDDVARRASRAACRSAASMTSSAREVYYFGLFPNLLLSLHPDYVMTHRIEPLAPGQSKVECQWLFPPEAQPFVYLLCLPTRFGQEGKKYGTSSSAPVAREAASPGASAPWPPLSAPASPAPSRAGLSPTPGRGETPAPYRARSGSRPVPARPAPPGGVDGPCHNVQGMPSVKACDRSWAWVSAA